MANKSTYNKKKFVLFFCAVIGLCAGARHLFSIDSPISALQTSVAHSSLKTETHSHDKAAHADTTINEEMETDEMDEVNGNDTGSETGSDSTTSTSTDEEPADSKADAANDEADGSTSATSINGNDAGEKPKHKIKGVWSYKDCFPDLQETQLKAAQKHGIHPVANREEADRLVKRHRLVNITHSPYYVVDDLTHSIPYLVPRAQHLLNTISMNFIDSCYAKGVPTHLLMVTSVLRTTDDVSNLQKGNKNATTNSCHCYGTTVDIAYNRFLPLGEGYDPNIALLRWDEPMKRILSEVLFDLRTKGKCYVKYERKQGCFHLTCR